LMMYLRHRMLTLGYAQITTVALVAAP
jgi:hypothetical protein